MARGAARPARHRARARPARRRHDPRRGRDDRADQRGPEHRAAAARVSAWRARARTRSSCAELVEASGRDPGYLACGTIAAARDHDEAEALDRELALRADLGLPVRRLLPSEARRLEPALAPVAAARARGSRRSRDRSAQADGAPWRQAVTRAGVELRVGAAVGLGPRSGDRVAGRAAGRRRAG